MKKIGEYTAKGQTSEAEVYAFINLFDGSYETGYKVKEFKIWGNNFAGGSQPDCIGKLATTADVSTATANFMNAQDNREIAWATSSGSTDSGGSPFAESIVDPDNLIIEDLYVFCRDYGGHNVNYMIVLEKYAIEDWEGAMGIVRNRSQGVG